MGLGQTPDRLALEGLLDQVDPPAGPIELVAGQVIGGTGGVAHAALDAGSQDALGDGSGRRLGEPVPLIWVRMT